MDLSLYTEGLLVLISYDVPLTGVMVSLCFKGFLVFYRLMGYLCKVFFLFILSFVLSVEWY